MMKGLDRHLRARLQAFLLQKITGKANHLTAADLARPAVVFAAHQDDETLGCGGTIIQKINAGGRVSIVFLSDGSNSHARLIPRAELREIRRGEALQAAQILGVPPHDVSFFEAEDGALAGQQPELIERLEGFFTTLEVDQVFIPSRSDPPSDHQVTNQVVRAAMDRVEYNADILEYPVWFWHHWPWTTPGPSRGEKMQHLRLSLACRLGLRLVEELDTVTFIDDVREQKRQALNQHQTQMAKFQGRPGWATLNDVSDGDFVACFFREFEYFKLFPRRQVGSVAD